MNGQAQRVALAFGALLMVGCASTPREYGVGEITVTIADHETVDRECRFRGHYLGQGQLLGCYVTHPARKPRIWSVRDVDVLLHEFKHHFEGAFHGDEQ